MSKSLLESAAEILNTTVGKDKEPMKKMAGTDAADLGGEMPTSADLNNMGAKAAAPVSKATAPTTKGDPKSVKVQAMEEVQEDEEIISEEEELTEEEIEEYLNSLSEEELEQLVAEAEELDEQGMTNVKLPLDKGVKAPYKKGATVASPKMAEETEELTDEQIVEARKAAVKEMVAKNMSSCKEDVDALFNGEALSEEFRNKATTIFEAAVRARVEAIANSMVEEHEQVLENTVAEIQEELSNQVDEYLNYVVENWMEENELAIETGIRSEISESFMDGLKNLFVEHYMEVPEDKADLVDAMAAEVAAAELALEEQTAKLAELTKALNESKAVEILRKTCEGLTEMQVAKIKALAEGVEFTTEGEYTEKLAVIRESYFPSGKTSKAAAPQVVVETEEPKGSTNNVMDYYVNAITKQLPK
jgi:hypothetical protein